MGRRRMGCAIERGGRVNAVVSAAASTLTGSRAFAALAACTAVFALILAAALTLTGYRRPSQTEASVAHHLAVIRDGVDDCPCLPCAEFEDHAEQALAIVADAVPGLVPADGKPLSRGERRALRGIEAASEKAGAGL